MVAQAVEQLGAVGLRVDRLQVDALDVLALLGPPGLGVEVDALLALPDAGQAAQGPEVGERVGIDVRGLGEDVVGELGHGRQIGSSIERARGVKVFGPAGVMYQQSSSRTPNSPGM